MQMKQVSNIEDLDTIPVGDLVEFFNVPSGKAGQGIYGIFRKVPGVGACFVRGKDELIVDKKSEKGDNYL